MNEAHPTAEALMRRISIQSFIHTHGAGPFLRRCQLCSHSRAFYRFMEHESSLPHSQEPSTGPCPDPIHTIPSYLSKIHFNIVHTHLRLGLPSGLFPYDFPINILHAFLFSQIVLHALPISPSFSSSF
jgi:hypothetical protein